MYTLTGTPISSCGWGSTCTANLCSSLSPYCSTPNSTYKQKGTSSIWYGGFVNQNQSNMFCTNSGNDGNCGSAAITNQVNMYASWYCTTLAEADSIQNRQCNNSDAPYKNSESCFSSAAEADAYIASTQLKYNIATDMSFTSSVSSIAIPACGTTYYCAHMYFDFCGSEFEKSNTQKEKSECCQANFAPGNNTCISPIALGGTGGLSTSSYLSDNFCSNIYGSAGASKFCQDSTSGEVVSSSSEVVESSSSDSDETSSSSSSNDEISSSSASNVGSSSSTEINSSTSDPESGESSGFESSSSEWSYESSSSDGEETSSSSSGNDEISSSSASDAGSSNSTEIGSSTSGPETGESSGSVSSSSEWSYESSSSGDDEISSSSMETESSSSADAMSSSYEQSSSSGDLCPQYPLASVPANPLSACFSYGGKCYKCNDDRGSECANDWLWIYNFNASNVGWWYTEVDCETGSEKTTEEGIGVCSAHPLNKVPSDPQNACFASNGKCYKCNDDRGSECGNDWLWIYDFNASNVGWWYTEVDCYNPNGDDGQCPDGSILQKSVAKANGNSQIESVDYTIHFLPSQKYFDVLGRKANHSSKQKRALYSLDRTNNQNSALTEDTEFSERILRLLNEHSSYNNVLRKSKSCGVLGGDYGIVEKDGSLTGGMTCPIVNTYYTLKYVEGPQKVGSCGANGDSAIVDVLVEDSLQSYLASDEHYVVPVNYIFPGTNYMVTKEDSIKLERHELGHVAYNECIEAKFPNEIEVVSKRFCECESTLQKSYEEWIEPLRQKKYVQDTTRFVRASDLFHEKYTPFDGADSYVCPSGL